MKHYTTKFRSLKSLNEYEFKLNLSSGYYQIISEWGNLKYQGYTLFEPRNLNYNNYEQFREIYETYTGKELDVNEFPK